MSIDPILQKAAHALSLVYTGSSAEINCGGKKDAAAAVKYYSESKKGHKEQMINKKWSQVG